MSRECGTAVFHEVIPSWDKTAVLNNFIVSQPKKTLVRFEKMFSLNGFFFCFKGFKIMEGPGAP
ncbi:MAG: hypothetical protein A2Y94_10210 [Caldithrix sp. RBG_13_44_9]|nr:MAG: hypothetical protein A2Y94_10210 [Caldithrix sp. RBG_13_44_9]